MSSKPVVTFTYTNHRGEKRLRTINPLGVEYHSDPGFGYVPGWFIRGVDTEKRVVRSFAFANIDVTDLRTLSLRW